jgi:hypothetical protein
LNEAGQRDYNQYVPVDNTVPHPHAGSPTPFAEMYKNLEIAYGCHLVNPGYAILTHIRVTKWQDARPDWKDLEEGEAGPSPRPEALRRLLNLLFSLRGYVPPEQYVETQPQSQ